MARNSPISLRLTDAERRRIERAAERAGWSMSDLVRRAALAIADEILAGPPPADGDEEADTDAGG